MFYEAIDESRVHTIGMATSTDGLRWSKYRGGAPVFGPAGAAGAWDGKAVARPWVVPMEDGSARMYYVGRGEGGETQGLGMAVSEGEDWTKWTRCTASGGGEGEA
jgi:lipoprotein-anchoring transpeptidase ErfK/SrfK